MFSSVFSRQVKLLSVRADDCVEEAIRLLIVLSDETESLNSPWESTWVSVLSKGRGEKFLTQLSSVLCRFLFLVHCGRVSFCWVWFRCCSSVLLARLSAIASTVSSKFVGMSLLLLDF